MTPAELRAHVRRLPAHVPVTRRLGEAIGVRHGHPSERVHWLRWLGEYSSPGFYGRRSWGGDRDASYAYKHLQCATMLLWLPEAAGVDGRLIVRAERAALRAPPRGGAQCGAIRKVIPWDLVETALEG